MKTVTLNLDAELASLDQNTALQFKHRVTAMLRLMKVQQAAKRKTPFAERIASHTAIGTWPAERNVDLHITELRDEWER